MSVLKDMQKTPGRDFYSGSWNHVPPGCSIQKGFDWTVHYNKNSTGTNNGRFSMICSDAQACSQEEWPKWRKCAISLGEGSQSNGYTFADGTGTWCTSSKG